MATTIKKATKTVQLGDLELDLKLGGREIFKIERRLGKSMLSDQCMLFTKTAPFWIHNR